jgi:hypothetical protein
VCDLSLLFLLVFLPSAIKWSMVHDISIFLGEAGIGTHVQGGSDPESSAFTTRPGGSMYFLKQI